jgi:hypothetical protein
MVYDPLVLCMHARHYLIDKDNCLFSDPNFDKKYKFKMHEEKHKCKNRGYRNFLGFG